MRRTVNIWGSMDWITVILYAVMVLLGWINIYSAVYNTEHVSIFDFSQRYGRQMVWILMAFVLAILTMMVEGRFLLFFSYFIYGLAIFLLILVLFTGTWVHGSRSWFSIGPLNLQPAEFAKIAASLALARYLSTFNLKIQSFRTMIISTVLLILPAVLILLQPDTGSALVFFSIYLVLFREGLPSFLLLLALLMVVLFILSLFISPLLMAVGLILLAAVAFGLVSGKVKQVLVALAIPSILAGVFLGLDWILKLHISPYLLILASVILSGMVYAYLGFRYRIQKGMIIYFILLGSLGYSFSTDYVLHNVLSDHQQKRIKILLGMESDPFGDGYNVNQSKIAIGSGGFWGKGFLEGTQTKFHFVPEQSTDFIFCTVGEEWGFVGSTVVILLYLFLLYRLILLAERQRSPFSRMYGYAVFSILFFHFFVNIGMTLGLVPVIGIPLPFLSYGGSSLWAFTILLFIFIRLDAGRMELL